MKSGRDVWWHEAVDSCAEECDVEWVDAETPLFMLYTSGSTGKPKGRWSGWNIIENVIYSVYTRPEVLHPAKTFPQSWSTSFLPRCFAHGRGLHDVCRNDIQVRL